MKYEIPEEMQNLQIKSSAANKLGKFCVTLPFGYKKALRSFVIARELHLEFWNKFVKLYPDAPDKVEYIFMGKFVRTAPEPKDKEGE